MGKHRKAPTMMSNLFFFKGSQANIAKCLELLNLNHYTNGCPLYCYLYLFVYLNFFFGILKILIKKENSKGGYFLYIRFSAIYFHIHAPTKINTVEINNAVGGASKSTLCVSSVTTNP